MAKPADTSFEAFIRENPEYNISTMLKEMPTMENVPLREGAPSSLAAVRRRIPDRDRVNQAMRESEDAYRKWKSRRIGALRYRSTPSVSDHLGDVQRQYDPQMRAVPIERYSDPEKLIRDHWDQIIRDIREQDTGLSEMEEFEDTGGFEDTGDFEDTGISPFYGERDMTYPQFSKYGKEEGLGATFTATESYENPEEAQRLQEALGYSQPSNVTQTDLGGGKVEIEIDNEDPDKRIRFTYDTKDDILKTYEF